jgi:hypothetical protein
MRLLCAGRYSDCDESWMLSMRPVSGLVLVVLLGACGVAAPPAADSNRERRPAGTARTDSPLIKDVTTRPSSIQGLDSSISTSELEEEFEDDDSEDGDEDSLIGDADRSVLDLDSDNRSSWNPAFERAIAIRNRTLFLTCRHFQC